MRRGIYRAMAWSLATVTACTTMAPITAMANASTNWDMRKKVIGVTGIMSVSGDMSDYVTRAEFARMLVMASGYRSVLTTTSNISVFADVKNGNEYASAIRIAAEHGWMTGYLGGNFKPDQYITLHEGAKGLLYLLGYTADDFSGDQYNKRMAKYAYLDLDENMDKEADEVLTREDCVNLFYNLLKCNKANSNTAYVSVLDGELSSDGEVNALSLADNSLKGPKACDNMTDLNNAIPFSLGEANLFLNGEAVTYDYLKAAMEGSDFGLVAYYSTVAKTVWAYDGNSENSSLRVVSGEITAIYYQSSSTLTPSSVQLDDGETYKLTSSDMQFAFSIYGSQEVGDEVTLIYEVSTDANGDETYTVTDYVAD